MAPKTPIAPFFPVGAAAIKQHLTQATMILYQAANDGNFAEVASRYYAVNCGGFHDMDTVLWEDLAGRGGAVAQIEEFLKSQPNFHTIVEDVTVDLSERLDRAVVWSVRTDSGLVDGLRRETVLRLTWTLGEWGWLCTESCGIRHFPFFTIDETLRGGGILPWSFAEYSPQVCRVQQQT